MAKAIKSIKKIELSEEERRAQDLKEIEDTLIDNKEALLETLEVVGHMKDRGVISLLNGMFGEGDRVLKVLVDLLSTKENTMAIKNLMLLVGALGRINVKELEPLIERLNNGIENVSENEGGEHKTGYLDLIKALKDPEINRSLSILLLFLKGMGSEKEEEK